MKPQGRPAPVHLDVAEGKRKCQKCHRVKALHLFRKHKAGRFGYLYDCRACVRKAARENRKTEGVDAWIFRKGTDLRGNWRARAGSDELRAAVPTAQEIREWLQAARPWVCVYTGQPLEIGEIGFDHAVPLARGGTFGLDNIVICHRSMNAAKGAMTFAEFMDLLTTVWEWEDRGEALLKRLKMSGGMFKGSRK